MMKKIKQIKDIQHEKLRLRLKQLELEKQISRNWDSVKKGLSFKNINADNSEPGQQKKQGDGSLLATIINYGAGYLSRHLSDKAGQQLEITLQKGAHKLAQKIKTVFHKRN
jgi:hypothetical protein